jgi:hypothetical protein
MKQNTKWLAAALAVAGGLAMASSAQAQAVTGTPYLSNVPPGGITALYAGWSGGGATITSLPTGLEIASTGYGSLYYSIPSPVTMNANDTVATLTFTVNSPSVANILWIGTPFAINDNSGNVFYGGYSASGNGGSDPGTTWNGNVVTETEPLSSGQLATIQAGGDVIYSFNLEVDPASFVGPPIYDITFNSLVLSPAPEPTTLALVGLGAASLLAIRRRK